MARAAALCYDAGMSVQAHDPKLQALIAKAPRWPRLKPPLPPERLPRHIAIIMDGNGRWARRRGLVRIKGHLAGVDAVRAITRYCGQVGVQALTLYAFSTENWKRPKTEVRFLFGLLKKYLIEERAELMANHVRLTSIGETRALPDDVQAELRRTEELTGANALRDKPAVAQPADPGLNLCLALNYGAHDEILAAVRQVAARVAARELRPAEITPELFESTLSTAGMPPLDLLIRTAGERRLSNFLLWQACGAEFYVTPVCWPDFQPHDLELAIAEFAKRREPC